MEEIKLSSELYKLKVGVGKFKVGQRYEGQNLMNTLYPLRNPKKSTDNASVFSFVGEQIVRIQEGDLKFAFNDSDCKVGTLMRDGYPTCDFMISGNHVTITSDHLRDGLKAYVLSVLATDPDFPKTYPDDEDIYYACDAFYFKYAQNKDNLVVEQDPKLFINKKTLKKPEFMKEQNQFEEPKTEPKRSSTKETSKKASKSTANAVWSGIKSGALRVFGCGVSDVKVPDVSFLDTYVPTEDYFFLVKHITYRLNRIKERITDGFSGAEAIGNDAVNFSLIGPPGTGKSVMAKALAATFGLPFGITRNSSDTDIDEYEGKTRLIDGTPQFRDTDSTQIAMSGGILANEEANLTPSGVITGALNQFAEKPFVLKRNGYENVERHPYAILCNLFNPTVRGGQIMNQSYISRFPITLDIQAPTKKEMAAMLLSKFDGNSGKSVSVPAWYTNPERQVGEDEAMLAYSLLEESVKYLKSAEAEDLALVLSTRQCIAFLQLLEEGFPKDIAFQNTFVNALKCIDTEQDRDDSVSAQYEKEFISMVFSASIWNTVA